ncbi:hypothetical protein ncot_07330 [Nocardioides sp. JQ2195]|uniref:hypothetical protein n=1 Tax=Nocardioides sp. JQ2195 TaxID=2592334 RepID=UPI00143E45D7|nr:hypothetical protein [Nocardioides sp. JQ2195]QIX26434.1 hypothetical protein ncot_07330 [Nocardioides sp. JQ2195]
MVATSVVLLVIGGCAMYLSWGAWGVFVTCSVLTLAGACAPVFLLLPRSNAAWLLLLRLAMSALLLMLAGWGLVALLNPAYVIGWWVPEKHSHVDEISNEFEALFMGAALLALGGLLSVAVIATSISAYRKDVRGPAQRDLLGAASRNPVVRNAGQHRPVSRRLRRARARQARRR